MNNNLKKSKSLQSQEDDRKSEDQNRIIHYSADVQEYQSESAASTDPVSVINTSVIF